MALTSWRPAVVCHTHCSWLRCHPLQLVVCLLCSAMGGSVKFEEALASRLTLMQVTSQKMEDFIQQHPPRLSPGKLGLQHVARTVALAGHKGPL